MSELTRFYLAAILAVSLALIGGFNAGYSVGADDTVAIWQQEAANMMADW